MPFESLGPGAVRRARHGGKAGRQPWTHYKGATPYATGVPACASAKQDMSPALRRGPSRVGHRRTARDMARAGPGRHGGRGAGGRLQRDERLSGDLGRLRGVHAAEPHPAAPPRIGRRARRLSAGRSIAALTTPHSAKATHAHQWLTFSRALEPPSRPAALPAAEYIATG